MSDFLTRLIARTKGTANVAQPVIQPVFAQVPSTLGYYADTSMQESQDSAILTSPSNYFASRKPNQPFRELSNNRFAPHIESAISDQAGSVFLPQKQNFSSRNESSINNVISEIDQNTSLLPQNSPDVKRDFSGTLIDSEHSSFPQNIPGAEADQKSDTQLKQSLNEKRDAYGALIKSDHISLIHDISQGQSDPKISLQPEHSLNDKQYMSGELISFDKALRKITESTEKQSTMTSYPEPHASGKIRIKQNAKPNLSSSEATIKVNIGRVEVRAIIPQASTTQAQRPRSQNQLLSLDDYLKRRNEGEQ